MARRPEPALPPADKRLAEGLQAEVRRQAFERMTRRQRQGLRLFLLRDLARKGNANAAKEVETVLTAIRRDAAIAACATEIKNENLWLTEDQARCLAEAALSRSNEELQP